MNKKRIMVELLNELGAFNELYSRFDCIMNKMQVFDSLYLNQYNLKCYKYKNEIIISINDYNNFNPKENFIEIIVNKNTIIHEMATEQNNIYDYLLYSINYNIKEIA